MKHTLLAFLIVCLWMPIQLPAQSDDGIHFSQVLGSLKFFERHEYEAKELGYSLRYENDKRMKADIYVYDKGIADLKEGINSPEVKAEMKTVEQGLHAMVEMGKYEDVEALNEATYESQPTGQQFLWSRFSLRQIGGEDIVYTGKRISETYLRVHKGKFLKIRITSKESDFKEHEKEIRRFVDQVAACLE